MLTFHVWTQCKTKELSASSILFLTKETLYVSYLFRRQVSRSTYLRIIYDLSARRPSPFGSIISSSIISSSRAYDHTITVLLTTSQLGQLTRNKEVNRLIKDYTSPLNSRKINPCYFIEWEGGGHFNIVQLFRQLCLCILMYMYISAFSGSGYTFIY